MLRKTSALEALVARFAQTMNFGRFGKWQAEQFANHRKRQGSCISSDEIGRTSLDKKLTGELAGDSADAGRHIEDRSATKRFLDDPAQPTVIRLVDGQHIFGKDAKYARHPPAYSGDGAIILAQSEYAIVLEHARGHLLCGGRPNLADHRQLDLDDRSGRPQSLERRGGVTKEVLADEVDAARHG